ncbi:MULTISPECIES: EamA family transporter [Vitreoscilla]|uniref:EamA family transporter n=1 Tax=Vitreoscilla stercoraria TaxID=61 RepID=A0ABY4EDI0_VITST|nr:MULTISPECIES: EamA family transporter [Vitreoscilla]UOO93470.1 EamA family transporter [Vitreoscilla stercoraria]
MSTQDKIGALLVVVLWGLNFYFIYLGLQDASPLLLGCLRFIFVSFPAIFFIKKPNIPWRWLITYGLLISFAQFTFLFWAIAAGLPTGLAAIVLQSQAFFTIIIAAIMMGENVKAYQIIAMVVAALGLGLIAYGQYQGQLPVLAVFLVVIGAFAWACGNITVKHIGSLKRSVNPLALVVWGNLICPLPFFIGAVAIDGWEQVHAQLTQWSVNRVIALAYLSWVASIIGYGLWGKLMSKYDAASIAPLSLFVPAVALVVAFLVLNEPLNRWHSIGIAVLAVGLCIHLLLPSWIQSQKTKM